MAIEHMKRMNHKDRFLATIQYEEVDRPAAWLGMPVPSAEPGLMKHFTAGSIEEMKGILDDDIYPVDVPYHYPPSNHIACAFDFAKTAHLDILRGLAGNEQLAEILKQHEALAGQAKEWSKLVELAAKRRPAWEKLSTLLRHAETLPEVAELRKQAEAVEAELAKMDKPIKVAVMGCVVNGPGEAQDADVGIACGKGKGVIFKKGEKVATVDEKNFFTALMKEVEGL